MMNCCAPVASASAASSREVNLAYVPEAKVGDYVIVHVGFALSIVDEDEAKKTFEYLSELGEIEEELGSQ